MKYNTTYTPKISLKDTILLTDEVRKKIIKYFESNYNLVNIMVPAYMPEDDELLLNFDEVTRGISFDTSKEYRVGRLVLTSSNYLRKMVRKLELKTNEGLITEGSFVWRDLDESPVLTPEKHEITIQFVAADKNDVAKQVAKQIYNVILEIAEDFKSRYKIKNIYPEHLPVISAQSLENEYPDKTPKNREIEVILEHDAFLFKNPGARLLTGHIHTSIPPVIYDLDDFYQIVLKDRINTYVLKVASVATIATGKKLSEQLSTFGLNDLKQMKVISSIIEDETNIIEVKFNLPRLMMALLGKGHIAEVQPGVYSDEEKTIKSRYKIETY